MALTRGKSPYDLKDKPYIDIRDYGAKGDGVTDDTAAIQAAIAAADAIAFEETTVLFPQGEYRVSTIDLTDTAYIRFHAAGTVQIYGNDATKNFLIGSTNYNTGSPELSTQTNNFSMTGGSWLLGAGGQSYKYGLRLEHFTKSVFENVSVSGDWDDGLGGDKMAVYMQYSYYNSFNNCSFAVPSLPNPTFYSYGFFIDTNNNNINTFKNCIFTSGGQFPSASARTVGIRISSNSNKLINCDTNTTDIGVWLFSARTTSLDSHYTEFCNTSVYATQNAIGTQVIGGIFEVIENGVAFDLGSSQNTTIISPNVTGLSGATSRTFIQQGTGCYGLVVLSPRLNNIDNIILGTYRGADTVNDGAILQAKWLSFPPTKIDSTDPNTLDDYEEGTWTPSGNNVTFVGASGSYTKVGNLVTLNFLLQWPVTADANFARIYGIPFFADLSSESNGIAIGYNTASFAIGGSILGATSYITIRRNGGSADVTNADMSNATVSGSITYRTSG